MTVCIAAIIDDGKAIAIITDQMLSVGAATVDLPTVLKSFRFHDRWCAMFAGDVTRVTPIMRRVTTELSLNPNVGITEASGAFARAYSEEYARHAERVVLSQFGLDMPTFTNLLANSNSAEISDMWRRIQTLDFDCEFLAAGYDPDGNAHIFTVRPSGVVDYYDPIRFWSIGSGENAALSSLMFRGLNAITPLKEAVYYVAEAKFMSESTVGVGKGALFALLTPDGKFKIYLRQDLKNLRKLWESKGKPPIPRNLDKHVADFWSQEDLEQSD